MKYGRQLCIVPPPLVILGGFLSVSLTSPGLCERSLPLAPQTITERSLPHQYGHFDDLVFGPGLAERHFEEIFAPLRDGI